MSLSSVTPPAACHNNHLDQPWTVFIYAAVAMKASSLESESAHCTNSVLGNTLRYIPVSKRHWGLPGTPTVSQRSKRWRKAFI